MKRIQPRGNEGLHWQDLERWVPLPAGPGAWQMGDGRVSGRSHRFSTHCFPGSLQLLDLQGDVSVLWASGAPRVTELLQSMAGSTGASCVLVTSDCRLCGGVADDTMTTVMIIPSDEFPGL